MKKQTHKKEVLHPDDHFFSVVMREVENARSYLVHFYPDLAKQLDLESLHLENTTFVNPQFKTFDSDIVYRCRFKEATEELYFSLLWEHKSYPEEEVAIQIGLYILQALYTLIKDKDRKLEPIIPLLFYNGKKGWKPKTIRQLFEDHAFFKTFEEYLPSFEFLFKHITQTPHEELLAIQNRFFRSAMIAMANRYNADLLIEYISVIFEVDDQDRLKALCTYFFAIIERSPKELQKIVKDIEFIAKPNFMSTLAQLLEEGMAKGIEMWDYKKNVITIRNMVRKKIPTNLMAEILSITSDTVKNIQKELSKEKKIIALLAKKQKPVQIAAKLEINVWLVEVLEEILKEDKKK